MKNLLSCKKGVTSIEYAIIASLISIFVIAGIAIVGEKTQAQYECIEKNVNGTRVDCSDLTTATGP